MSKQVSLQFYTVRDTHGNVEYASAFDPYDDIYIAVKEGDKGQYNLIYEGEARHLNEWCAAHDLDWAYSVVLVDVPTPFAPPEPDSGMWLVTYEYRDMGWASSDTRTYSPVKAETGEEAIEAVIARDLPRRTESVKRWVRSCMTARKLANDEVHVAGRRIEPGDNDGCHVRPTGGHK